MTESMLVTAVEKVEVLRELSAELQSLGPTSPMMSPAWLSEWWRCFGERSAQSGLLTLVVQGSQGDLIGFAPLYVDPKRTIRFLGSGRVCSDHLTILCRPAEESRVTEAVANWLFDEMAGRQSWQALDLEAIDVDDSAMRAFAAHLDRRPDALMTCRPDTGSWYLELPASWDDYLQTLTKGRRKRCRRWQRDYFESGRARLRVFYTADQLEEGFEVLEHLHNRRRRSLGEEGVFEDPVFRAFHRAAAVELMASDALRIHCLELEGRPVAAEYLLVDGQTVYAYQSGIDPEALDHGPGNLSVMASIRWAIESGRSKFDFMRGDESYKSNWGAVAKPAIRLRVWQRTAAGRLQQLAESARQTSKPVLKSLLPG